VLPVMITGTTRRKSECSAIEIKKKVKGCRFVSTDTPKWSHDIDRTTVYSPARHNVLRAAEKQRRRLNKNKNNDHGGDTLLKKDNETKI